MTGALLVCVLALAAQAPVEAPAAEIAPWSGDLSAGLAQLDDLAGEADAQAVTELADQLGAAARARKLAEGQLARVLFDTGLARARVGALEGALADLHSAAGLAGPGALRGQALYAAGTALLERAELLRREVPEIAEALGLPAPPTAEGENAPDPLDLAREAYLAAREALCERLALDWRDEDTRANLELTTRRLRELEKLEREREQQEQEQQQQQQQQDPQDPQSKDQPPDDQQQKSDSEQQDPNDASESQEDPSDEESEPQDPSESEDGEQEPKPEPEPQEGEQSEPEQNKDPSEGQPESETIEERVLSKEEVQRLLDQLAEIEEQAQAVRARLRERRRKPVEKDW